MFGAAVLLIVLLAAILAPVIAPYPPNLTDGRAMLQSPSLAHPLGTDNLGRDQLSRLLWGGRWSLGAAMAVGAAIAMLGTVIGLVSGLAGGWVDGAIMRLVDVLLSLPGILLALAIVGALGPGLPQIMLAAIAIWWVDLARIVRSTTLRLRTEQFVTAAQVSGASTGRILTSHILPNVAPVAIVLASLSVAGLLLSLAGLSFLGFGAQPPTPEWGVMLENGRPYFQRAPHLMVFPGLAITISALAFALVGDGLRDLLDPRLGR
jgi:ABC-type dipeptide/oligopeptide/nickel transport system permease subunit